MTSKKNNCQKITNNYTTPKCCESGCEDCPWDFQKNEIDPDIPRELQLNQNNSGFKEYELIYNENE